MRKERRLTDDFLAAADKRPGRYSDGNNLYLVVKDGVRWVFLFRSPTHGGRLREMGLGSFKDVSVAAARVAAKEARQLLIAGLDPIDEGFNKGRLVPF